VSELSLKNRRTCALSRAHGVQRMFFCFVSLACAAVFVTDGTLSAAERAVYASQGSSSVQSVETSFGDHTTAGQGGSGSEIDAVYAIIQDNVLQMFIAGEYEQIRSNRGIAVRA
jgi:hypothetical protein